VRAETIEFECISLSGDVQQFKWKDRLARIALHEMDHLKGIGFVDHLSSTAKLEIRSELDDLCTVFEGDQRLGFVSAEILERQLEEYERKFC
jgi:hypothetical protein